MCKLPKNKFLINLYCGLVPDKTKREKIRMILLGKDKTEFLEQQNSELLSWIHNLKDQNNDLRRQLKIFPKKNVLIISSNFTGGGLEKRINNIVNRFHDNYSFSLITQTPKKDMKTKPSKYIEYIYAWDEYEKALNKVDIIDVHPFGAQNLIAQWHISPQIRKIYTLHGEPSVTKEDLKFLQEYDHIYSVSKFLIPLVKQKYPDLQNKISLSINCDVIEDFAPDNKKDKNVLFSITNTNDKEYIQEIISQIPQEYTIHMVGNFTKDMLARSNGKIIFHGFVNIPALFTQYHFCTAFARGGFAAMDIISRNIPCFCISSNTQGRYLELLSRNNFSVLSDCNFVTRKIYKGEDILFGLNMINTSPKNYECSDLLKRHNDIGLMQDIFEI